MSKAKVTFPSAPDTSAIDIEDEGSLIVSNPTAMNFTGPGVTVTENPAGTAEVDIPGLQYWTESEDAAVQQSTIFTPNNAATDVNAVLLPKGNGANTAQTPDNTTTGGNARGAYATDWQKVRDSSNLVASGDYSTIAGGGYNRASGDYSFATNYAAKATGANSFAAILNSTASGSRSFSAGINSVASGNTSLSFGLLSTASGQYSEAHGNQSRAYNANQVAFGFETPGVGLIQHSVIGVSVPGATSPTLTSGATVNLGVITPPDANRVYNVIASWTAVVINITGTATGVSVGDYITQCNLFGFKRVAGTGSVTTITTVATHGDASMTGSASMAYTSSGNNLLATFTAPTFSGGGSVQVRIAVKYQVVEVAW